MNTNLSMRHILKSIIISSLAFYIAFTLVPTINIGQDPKNLPIVIGGFIITALIIRPIFSLVLIPINILTISFVSFGLNLALIFAYTRFLPGFSIGTYDFPGANFQGVIIPPVNLTLPLAILAVAAIITVIQKILHLIFE
ncbi:MAG: phage holin family protein [Candidatus Curtissbacteria bacterium]|nr:phage holin family protein [Candidatus Curtissbacteria bacterium]